MSLEAYSKNSYQKGSCYPVVIGIILEAQGRIRELYERGSTASKICRPQPGLNLGRHRPSYSLRTPF